MFVWEGLRSAPVCVILELGRHWWKEKWSGVGTTELKGGKWEEKVAGIHLVQIPKERGALTTEEGFYFLKFF